jgi:hypothetical protein
MSRISTDLLAAGLGLILATLVRFGVIHQVRF